MKLLAELQCKNRMEKAEARTSHAGEIWEWGSDSVVTPPLFTSAVGPSRPPRRRSAGMTAGGTSGGSQRVRPGRGRAGRAVPRSRPRAYNRAAAAAAAGPAAAMALRCLLLLLCGAALGPAVHLDFAEHRSQAAKIKVNPRGNLWATGHFMGKKSVTGSPHLETAEEPAVPMVFGPSLRALLEDMMELLTRELLKILLQERLLDENQGKYDLTDQETGLLTKVLEKYFSN